MKTDISPFAPKCLGLNRNLAAATATTGESIAAVKRIDAALKRLDNGEYGLCLACGQNIALSILDRDPAATQCATCRKS